MPRPKKLELEFPTSVYPIALALRIPYTRMYNLMATSGIVEIPQGSRRVEREIPTEEALQQVILLLMNRSVPAESLVKVFGSEMTLGQLARLAEDLAPIPEPVTRRRNTPEKNGV